MNKRLFGWDLPPGVSPTDIPGNRPKDEAWERIYDNFWDKERLTNTHIGIQITEKEYAEMDKLYNGKHNDIIDNYLMAAIEYGIEVGHEQSKSVDQENRSYESTFIEETLEKEGVKREVIDKILKILKGDYETP